jgi:hypothetical protein
MNTAAESCPETRHRERAQSFAQVETGFIDPGKRWQNGADESLNGTFRDEDLSLQCIDGAQLMGEVVQYKDAYRLCYIRAPEGLLRRTATRPRTSNRITRSRLTARIGSVAAAWDSC